jgi:hypothetical protein
MFPGRHTAPNDTVMATDTSGDVKFCLISEDNVLFVNHSWDVRATWVSETVSEFTITLKIPTSPYPFSFLSCRCLKPGIPFGRLCIPSTLYTARAVLMSSSSVVRYRLRVSVATLIMLADECLHANAGITPVNTPRLLDSGNFPVHLHDLIPRKINPSVDPSLLNNLFTRLQW